jgi:putative DNA primase/helicase
MESIAQGSTHTVPEIKALEIGVQDSLIISAEPGQKSENSTDDDSKDKVDSAILTDSEDPTLTDELKELLEEMAESECTPEPETLTDSICRLAELDRLEYERVRTAEAKRLGIRVSELDIAVANAVEDDLLAGPENESVHDAVIRLAAMTPLDYEPRRTLEAKRLGMRAIELDRAIQSLRPPKGTNVEKGLVCPDTEPWPENVLLSEVLNEIRATIHRYIVCDQSVGVMVALWTAFTWLIDYVLIAPILVISAPEKRCGKTQLLEVVGRLARRPLMASNISPAAVFRVIESRRPTLLIDEADSFMNENEQLRGLINCGHTRTSAYVVRTVGDDHDPVQFSTWSAKAIAGIGSRSGTIMDRAVVATLRRKLNSEKCERLRHADPTLFSNLASKLARFAQDEGHAIARARPALPDEINDRAQDNWEPLLAIADLAGGVWPAIARATAIQLSEETVVPESTTIELLADIRSVFERKNIDWIHTADLISALIEDDSKRWARFAGGQPINPRQLGTRLSEFGIHSRDIRDGHIVKKGHRLQDFSEAFARYLSDQGPGSNKTQQATEQPQCESTRSAYVAETRPDATQQTGG